MGIILIATSLLAGTYPSSAHTSLVSSQPKVNERVSSPLLEISLQFDEDLITLEGKNLNKIALSDADGRSIALGKTNVLGSVARASLDSSAMTSGTYYVQYRIVSGDGHVVSSQYQFTYSAVTEPKVTPRALPGENRDIPKTRESIPDTGTNVAETLAPIATSQKHASFIHKHGNHIIYSLGGFAAIVIWFLIRRRRG